MEKETSVKDIQDKINSDHPFGLKIWKPALYKKDRSINIKGIKDTRSYPGEMPLSKLILIPGNLLWVLTAGWVLFLLYAVPLVVLFPLTKISHSSQVAQEYFILLRDLAFYVLWPFGKFITRRKVLNEEEVLLLSPQNSPNGSRSGKRKEKSLKDRIREEGIVGLIYYAYCYTVLAPVHLVLGLICMIGVFSIPMAKLNYLIVRHCTRHPLELRVYSGFFQRDFGQSPPQSPSGARNRDSVLFWRRSTLAGENTNQYPMHEGEPIVLCLYKALGWKYYKYTIGGINIIVINLFILVLFTILDYYWIKNWAGDSKIASHGVIFSCALLSTIPLAYFIGMAVSSITVQSGNIALGSVINATFGSIIEIILYCFAIIQGRVLMVEGAIIGSILCGLLALPGVSMFSGGLIRKEQSFNAKAAGVSTTMLLMSVLGVYSPTIFQMIYGSVEIKCKPCLDISIDSSSCSQCVSVPVHPSKDPIYISSTRPFMYVCACALVMTYGVGLWFTLMTHTDKIYSSTKHKKKPRPIFQIFNFTNAVDPLEPLEGIQVDKLDMVEEETQTDAEPGPSNSLGKGKVSKRSRSFLTKVPLSKQPSTLQSLSEFAPEITQLTSELTPTGIFDSSSDEESEDLAGGHDSLNWSTTKSALILLGCTILYSLIAEILIGSVDGFLSSFPISEKFLGLTLFAIAPTVTEFYNAVSFAMSGNIALSLEIGSAYVIQVTLLQIPVLVGFSAFWSNSLNGNGFTLIFPPWDLACIFFSVFLLSYIYIEGKSNYFKGVILLLAYCLLMIAFLFVPVFDPITIA